MKPVKGVLFDNDGTLVDTYELILDSFRHATRTVLGRELADEVLMQKVGQPVETQVRDFSDDPEVQTELARVYREYNHTIHDERIRAFEGARSCLAALAERGLSLGVVTSKRHQLAWHGLEILGMAPYLDCCIGADDCEQHKPDPAPVALGARRLGLEPDECLYVGDSPFDIQAGAAAGCTTVAVLWGMFDEETLAAQAPDHLCANFEQLEALCASLQGHNDPAGAQAPSPLPSRTRVLSVSFGK